MIVSPLETLQKEVGTMWMRLSVKPGTTTLRVRKIDRRRGRVNVIVEGDLPAIVSVDLFHGPILPKQIKKVRREGCDALHCRFARPLSPELRIAKALWPDLLGPSEKVKEVTIRYPRVLDYVWSQGNQGKLVGWGLIPCRQLQEMVPIYLPPWYSHQELYVLRVEYEGSLPIRWGDRLVHDYGSFEVLRALPGEVEVGLWELGMEILSGGKDKRIRVRRYPRIATWDLGISWWLAGVPGLGVSEAALEELRSVIPQVPPLILDAPPLGREIFAHLAASYPAVCGEMAMRAYPSYPTLPKFWRKEPLLLEFWGERLKSLGGRKEDAKGLIEECIDEEVQKVRKNMEWFRGEVEKMVEGLFLEWEEEPPPIAVQTCAIRLGIQSSSKELFKSGVIELLNRRMYEVNVAGMFAGEAIVGEYYGIPPHIAYAMGWWLPRSYNGFVLIAEAGSGYTEVIPYDRLRVMEGCTSFVVPPDFGAQKSSGTKKIFLVPLLTKDIEGGPTPFSLPEFDIKDSEEDWMQKLSEHPLLNPP